MQREGNDPHIALSSGRTPGKGRGEALRAHAHVAAAEHVRAVGDGGMLANVFLMTRSRPPEAVDRSVSARGIAIFRYSAWRGGNRRYAAEACVAAIADRHSGSPIADSRWLGASASQISFRIQGTSLARALEGKTGRRSNRAVAQEDGADQQ